MNNENNRQNKTPVNIFFCCGVTFFLNQRPYIILSSFVRYTGFDYVCSYYWLKKLEERNILISNKVGRSRQFSKGINYNEFEKTVEYLKENLGYIQDRYSAQWGTVYSVKKLDLPKN